MEINIKMDWDSMDSDIASAVKEEILSAVQLEVRKNTLEIRKAVSRLLDKRQRELIAKALESMKT